VTFIGNAAGLTNVTVLLNAGDGTFGSPVQLTVPLPPNELGALSTYYVGFGDLNNDAKQDLIFSLPSPFRSAKAGGGMTM
jgi:hypothetical protein